MEARDYQVKIIVKETGEVVLRERTIKAMHGAEAAQIAAESYFGGEQMVEYWCDAGTSNHFLCDYDNELRIVVGKTR